MDAREIVEGLSAEERQRISLIDTCYQTDDLSRLPYTTTRRLFDLGLVEAYPVASKNEITVWAKFTFTDLGREVAKLLEKGQEDES